MGKKFIVTILFLALATVMAASAFAEEDPEHKWSVGAQGGYLWFPDFMLDGLYEEHTSITAGFAGLYGAYGFKQFDLVFGVNQYFLNFEDGEWLVDGEEEDETDYVEADLNMTSIEVAALWKWKLHDYVRYRLGAGLGFGFLYGTYESYDVVGGIKQEDKDTPSIPVVLPVINVQTGFTFFFVPDRFGLNIDFGIRNGFFAGGGLQGFF